MSARQKPRALLAIVIAIGILFQNGCAVKEKKPGHVMIRYLTWEIRPVQRELAKRIIKAFEKKYPKIKVKLEFSGQQQGMQKTLVQIAGGTAPDVFYCVSNYFLDLAMKGSILDLSSFIENDMELNMGDYYSIAVDACRYNEGIYALPMQLGVNVFFYNKDLFDRNGVEYPHAGWTWIDYLEASKKITKDTDGDGRIDQFGTITDYSGYENWVEQNGGRILNEDGTRCLLDDPRAIEAIQFLIDLRLKHHVTPSLMDTRERIYQLFETGKIGMFRGGSYLLQDCRNIKNFRWDVVPLPIPPKGRKIAVLSLGFNCISTQSKHPEEAWKFVKFYAGPEGIKLMAQIKNCVPALKSVAEEIFDVPPPDNVHAFLQTMEYSRLPAHFNCLKYREVRESIIMPEIELAYLGKQSVEEAAKKIVSGANKLLGPGR